MKAQYLQELRENYDYSLFRDLGRGHHLKLAKELGINRNSISRIVNEIKIIKPYIPKCMKYKLGETNG